MHTSKLFLYLDAFEKDEWKPFRHFLIGSKGDHSDVFKLFKEIYKNRRNLSSDKLRIDVINQEQFPQLSRKSFQNIMSVLKNQIENFWIWDDLNRSKVRRELHKLEALNKRGLFEESTKSLQSLEKKIVASKTVHLWYDYYLIKARFEIFFSNNPIKENLLTAQKILTDSIRTLSTSTVNLLTYYRAELYNRQIIKLENWDVEIDIIENLNLNPEKTILNSSLNEQVELIRSEYTSSHVLLLNHLKDESITFSPELKVAYFYHIRRYLILQVRQGNKAMISQLLKLIKWSLDSEMLLYNGELQIAYFIGDLSILCALNETEEAELYQERYINKLNPKDRLEGKVLGDMMINFVRSNYEVVIESYVSTVFKKVSRRLQASGMFLRASYELYGKDVDYFAYHNRNVADFIRRNKRHMSVQQVRSWKNFIFYLSKILKGAKEEKLLRSIKESKDIIHRGWLEEKIKEGVIK